MKNELLRIVKKFSIRKIILALADMFIISVSALIAVFALSWFSHAISVKHDIPVF